MVDRFESRAVISGIGISDIGRRLERSSLDLALDAVLEAVADQLGIQVGDDEIREELRAAGESDEDIEAFVAEGGADEDCAGSGPCHQSSRGQESKRSRAQRPRSNCSASDYGRSPDTCPIHSVPADHRSPYPELFQPRESWRPDRDRE